MLVHCTKAHLQQDSIPGWGADNEVEVVARGTRSRQVAEEWTVRRPDISDIGWQNPAEKWDKLSLTRSTWKWSFPLAPPFGYQDIE